MKEVEARLKITSDFLEKFPVPDVGFEFIVYADQLDTHSVNKLMKNFAWVKEQLEIKYDVKIHPTLHFPTTFDSQYFLGSDDPVVVKRVLKMFDGCVKLAKEANMQSTVIHAGGNITTDMWDSIKNDFAYKKKVLDNLASRLEKLLEVARIEGYEGKFGFENMPWPFDVPNAFTFTNMVTSDFYHVFNELEGRSIENLDQLGICLDLCHSWIISKTARYYKTLSEACGRRITPMGIFSEEWEELMKLEEKTHLIRTFGDKICHVHLADSRGTLKIGDGIERQLTEGAEIGTGDFSRSPDFKEGLQLISAKNHSLEKLICTLEIKDRDFFHPEKTARSLLTLGNMFYT
ncbi:MAG: sugar phosphate isomerase/epimerase family protein [Candidatus Hodarchaeota archaeon]